MSSRLQTYTYIFLATVLTGVYVVLWIPVLNTPADAVNRDFTIFATAARVVEQHGYPQIYDINLQRTAQQEIVATPIQIGGGLLPFNHPPFLMPLMQLVIGDDIFQSYLNWTLINVIFIGVCLWLSRQILSHSGWQTGDIWLFLIPLALVFPLQINLLQGQDILVVLIGLLLFLRAMQLENWWLGGIGLALTTISPHLALIFAVPWFFSRQNKFYSFVLFAGLLTIISVIMIRLEGVQDYLEMLSETAGAVGDTFGVNKIQMFSFSSLGLRLWPTMPDAFLSFLTWGGYLAGMLWLCWLHYRYKSGTQKQAITLLAVTVAIGLFFAPHLHSHSLLPIWVVFLIWGINRVQIRKHSALQVGLWVLLASLAMVPIFVPVIPLGWVGVFVVVVAYGLLTLQQLRTD
ncbi:MAG: glycosyltransferase 87 family protein [Chloroflexota bacterium]